MGIETNVLNVTTREGITVTHLYQYHVGPGSHRLLVILPGRGYTYREPALYYLRLAGLDADYDVLCVEYGFQASRKPTLDALSYATLMDEVDLALAQVLERGYERLCIAGKSLGTPVASRQGAKYANHDARLLLLTPVDNAVQDAGTLPTLAIIGTADAAYNADQIEADATRTNIEWRIWDGLNHGLEAEGDWSRSHTALGEITAACEAFLRAT